MNKHQLKGRINQATGKLKEFSGKLFGNKTLEVKGITQKTGGKIDARHGDLKNDVAKHN